MNDDISEDDEAGKTAHRSWLSGEISGPGLVLVLVVLVVAGLGGASIGGGLGLAVTLIALAGMVVLLVTWSGAPDRSLHTRKRSHSAAESDD